MSISLWETEEDVCNVVSGTTFLVPGSVRFLVILRPQVTGTVTTPVASAGHPSRSENDKPWTSVSRVEETLLIN